MGARVPLGVQVFLESPGRFYRGDDRAIQRVQLFSEIDVGRIEAGGRLHGRRGRGMVDPLQDGSHGQFPSLRFIVIEIDESD